MMEKCILEAIERFSLLDGVGCVTVALSGGADSMALLKSLLSLKELFGISVNAAHLNHSIRGKEAFRDEEFVKDCCASLGVELLCKRADVPKFAKEKGVSVELAARELRYKFFEEINKGVVATAHTASDNLETMIFNLTRGTAIDGLCGIPPKRDIFIRPLILCTRAQVEEYCSNNSVPFITDSTNLSDAYTRNKIRHNIVPILRDINPSVETVALRTAFSLREDSEIIEKMAIKYLTENKYDGFLLIENFSKLSPSVAKRVIKKYIEYEYSDISISNTLIENVYSIALKGGKCSLPTNCFAISKGNKLAIKKNSDDKQKNINFMVNITEHKVNFLKSSQKINNLLLKNLLDCDNIVGKLVIRTRTVGDKIRLKNRGCTKSLNQIYNEEKIPVEIRDKLPVISDDIGVVWIFGIGVAHRCAVNQKTNRVYEIEAKKEER